MINSLIEKYPSYKDLINSLDESLTQLKELQLDSVSAKGPPVLYLLTWKLKSYCQTCLLRITELTNQSLIAWDNSIPSLAFLCVRSVLETSAYFFDLSRRLESVTNTSKDINLLTEFIDKWKFGDRNIDGLPEIINVKTIIQKASKVIPDIESNYNNLSSLCHPNYAAIGGLYSFQNMDELCFYINSKYGLREDLFEAIIVSLSESLSLTKLAYNNFESLYPIINEINKKEQDNYKY